MRAEHLLPLFFCTSRLVALFAWEIPKKGESDRDCREKRIQAIFPIKLINIRLYNVKNKT